MEYPKMEEAARLMLIDQGLSAAGAALTVQAVVNTPENCPGDDGVLVTPEMFAEYETWAAGLTEDLLAIACCGCDETPANGPITYTDGSAMGSKGCIFVIIPENCARVLAAIFDSLVWEGIEGNPIRGN